MMLPNLSECQNGTSRTVEHVSILFSPLSISWGVFMAWKVYSTNVTADLLAVQCCNELQKLKINSEVLDSSLYLRLVELEVYLCTYDKDGHLKLWRITRVHV